MTTARKLLTLGTLALLTAAGLGAWWCRAASAERAVVAAALPAIPDLSAASDAARDGILNADARARSLPHARRGLAELSGLYHANGFLEAAMRCYEGLERLEPAEPRWPHRHATLLAGYGEIEPALALWRHVVALAPGYEPARLRLGDAFLKMNRLEEAAAVYNEVLRRNPKNPYAQLGLARLDFEAQRWDRARERLEQVVTQTNYELGYDLIVSLYERTGDEARAEAIRGAHKASGAYRDPTDPWLDELIDVCFDPYRIALAAGAVAPRAPDKAVHLLERAIALAPGDVATRYQLATLWLQQQNFEQAREQLGRCTALAPDFPDGWAQLSGLQAQLGETAAAERTLNRGLQLCPGSPGLHLMRARKFNQAGRSDEAIAEYKISAALRPNEAEAYLEVGRLLIGLNRTAEGVEQVQAALHAEPGNPMALSILAFNAIMEGDEAEARRWLARVKAQPRVGAAQTAQLLAAFQQHFGKSPLTP